MKYGERLLAKATRELGVTLYQYDHLMILEYLDSSYKKNKGGYLAYLEDLFYHKCLITLDEYNRLWELA